MSYESQKQQELHTTKEKVKLILNEHPEARNNDSILIVLFLEHEGVNGWGKLMDAASRQSINFESIRRARQMLQASGQYLPTDETIIKRRRLQAVYMAAANMSKKEFESNGKQANGY
jgi:hypothetical protein